MPLEITDALDRLAIRSFVTAGTVLFRSGDPISAVFLVRTGRVVLERNAGSGLIDFDLIGPGEIAGWQPILKGTYTRTAHAAEDTQLGYIPAAWVIELLEGDLELSAVGLGLAG